MSSCTKLVNPNPWPNCYFIFNFFGFLLEGLHKILVHSFYQKKKFGPHPLGTSVLVGTKPSFYFLLFFPKKKKKKEKRKKKSPVCTKQITTAQQNNPVRANVLSHSVFKITDFHSPINEFLSNDFTVNNNNTTTLINTKSQPPDSLTSLPLSLLSLSFIDIYIYINIYFSIFLCLIYSIHYCDCH